MSGMDNWRNRLAARLCSWVLVHIADDSYERYIGGAIRYGMRAAAEDERTSRLTGHTVTDYGRILAGKAGGDLDSLMARAWDEGYDAGERCTWDAGELDHECYRNPYRKDEA